MKNEMSLDGLKLENLGLDDQKNTNGGGWIDKLTSKAVKFTWTGSFDGDPSNDESHLYLFGFKIF